MGVGAEEREEKVGTLKMVAAMMLARVVATASGCQCTEPPASVTATIGVCSL
ncbi:hypothetical protein LIA77_03907 [Sarocladium implicatum]|nr:hypothetical protein LIA77_03907 [Sarocladium implicatum]